MNGRGSRGTGALRMAAFLAAMALMFSVPSFGQKKSKDDEGNTRTVSGDVTSPDDSPVGGAVVQLKNTKTLEIRSFITKDDGSYYFNGLSPDVDYELRAQSKGLASSTKTLSSFDSRKAATINLKLNKK